MKDFRLILKGPPETGKSSFREELRLHWLAIPSRLRHFYITSEGCLEHELRITAKPESLTKEEQKMDKKYKPGPNSTTAAKILEIGNSQCDEFRKEFNLFINWCHIIHKDFNFFGNIYLHDLEQGIAQHPEWEKFFLDNDFIRKTFQPYKAGDVFVKTDSIKYKLSIVAENHLLLITENGRTFYGTPAIHVKNVDEVTEEEFYKITRHKPEQFTKVEEDKTSK